MDEEVDYKALLFKYMKHVGDYEGTDFVSKIHCYPELPRFTEAEIRVLKGE